MGFVYFFSCRDLSNNHFIKIGFTGDDPIKRISTLQTGCPFKITLFKLYKFELLSIAKDVEKLIHNELDSFRFNGEWFIIENVGILNDILSALESKEVKRNYLSFPDNLMGLLCQDYGAENEVV